jgi:sulfate adenylyltransferase
VGGQGVCIWFTGRSGAGKSTVTAALVPMLEAVGRTVTVLDVVPELARSRGERSSEAKLLRKAFVAREVVRHGGVAIAVTVSARAEVRAAARAMVGADPLVEVHADVPAEVSLARKSARTKRPPLRKRVRQAIRRARGAGDPGGGYEAPTAADLTIDTVAVAPEDNARAVLALLSERGFVPTAPRP